MCTSSITRIWILGGPERSLARSARHRRCARRDCEVLQERPGFEHRRSPFSGPARHLKRQGRAFDVALGFGVDAWRMVRAEFLHQHGLAHARVAEDRDRGHSRRAGMVKNLVEDLDHLLHPGIAYPTLRTVWRGVRCWATADQEVPVVAALACDALALIAAPTLLPGTGVDSRRPSAIRSRPRSLPR